MFEAAVIRLVIIASGFINPIRIHGACHAAGDRNSPLI
jgi:hypothetical protein